MVSVVEIRAATLPGFPYQFPYQTGVRLFVVPTATMGFVQTASSNAVAVTAGLNMAMMRTAFLENIEMAITATVTAGAQVIARGSAALNLDADVLVSPLGLEGTTLLARAQIPVQVSAEVSVDRETFADADCAVAVAVPASETFLDRVIAALLAVRADRNTTVLYNHSGGNPMWLMFFYAGLGQVNPVAAPGSTEE